MKTLIFCILAFTISIMLLVLIVRTIKTRFKIQLSGIEYRVLKFKSIFDPSVNLNEWLNNKNILN